MDFNHQSYGNQKISSANPVVTKNFSHHMLGDHNFLIVIFSMSHNGLAIYIKKYFKEKK
jgi:hypothetical protein